MFPEDYPESGGTITLTREFVRGIGHLGGTVLGSTNRGDPTNFPVQQSDGSWSKSTGPRSSWACSARPASTP